MIKNIEFVTLAVPNMLAYVPAAQTSELDAPAKGVPKHSFGYFQWE